MMGNAGVVTEEGQLVKNSTFTEEFNTQIHLDGQCIRYYDYDVVFLGVLWNVYGHSITDNLKKLWCLQKAEIQNIIEGGCKLVYVTLFRDKLKSYVYDIFTMAGFDLQSAECISRPTRFRRVFVPENSIVIKADGKRYCGVEYVDVIKNIVAFTEGLHFPVWDKVYLSRTWLENSRDFGEKQVERLFEKNGYHIVHPETLPVAQQVYLMAHCKKLATTVGSLSHSAVFCKPGTEVLLLDKAGYVNAYQEMIDSAFQLKALHIKAHHTLPRKDVWRGPFFLSCTKQLRRYFNISGFDLYFLQRDWWKYLVRYLHDIIGVY
jgi:capsular polysaccharide biosynthesis protein